MMSEDDECPICRELLFNPVTLFCGHTACERCVAAWVARAPAVMRCPAGCASDLPRVVPHINRLLQAKLEASFPNDIAVRRAQTEELENNAPVLPSAPRDAMTGTGAGAGGGGGGAGGGAGGAGGAGGGGGRGWARFCRQRVRGTLLNGVAQAQERLGPARKQDLVIFVLAVFLWLFGRLFVGVPATSQPPHMSVAKWTPSDVSDWLTTSGLEEAVDEFALDGVDGSALVKMDDADFLFWDLPPATAIKLAKAHAKLLAPPDVSNHSLKGFWLYRLSNRYFTTTCVLLVYSPRLALFLMWMRDPALLAAVLPSASLLSVPLVLFSPGLVMAYAGMLLTTLNPVLAFGLLHTGLFQSSGGSGSAVMSLRDLRNPLRFAWGGIKRNVWVYAIVLVLVVSWPLIPWMLSDILLYAQIAWIVTWPLWRWAFVAGGAHLIAEFLNGFFNAL